MNKLFFIAILFLSLPIGTTAQTATNRLDSILPVCGLSVEAPAPETAQHFQGIIATVWSGNKAFLQSYNRAFHNSLIQIFRKLMGSLGSPCACKRRGPLS